MISLVVKKQPGHEKDKEVSLSGDEGCAIDLLPRVTAWIFLVGAYTFGHKTRDVCGYG